MKVLIIEDNDYKLDDAVRILESLGINERVHVNNYMEAYRMCFRQNLLDEIDFIILDIQFFEYRPLIGGRQLPDQYAGYKFLMRLAEKDKSIPVFIFSSVDDFEKGYQEFLFPSFTDYSRKQQSSDFIFSRVSSYREKYNSLMETHKELLAKTNFVVGHAHSEYELRKLITNYLSSNNQT